MLEKTISEEVIYKGRVVELLTLKVELPDGKVAEREVILHHGGAGVLAIDAEDNCHMVEQFRTAVGQVLLEIPAGKLEKGEDPKACALRELEEETGYKAAHIRFLGDFIPTPGYDSEVLYLYLATELSPGTVNLDEGEFLSSHKRPFAELLEMTLKGEIKDAKTAIAILLTDQLRREAL